MSSFLDLIVLCGSTTLAILITVPLTGALVRLRANYNPKGLQLDQEGNVEPHTGPVVTSFFGMLKRVKRIEVSLTWQNLRQASYRRCVRAGEDCTRGQVCSIMLLDDAVAHDLYQVPTVIATAVLMLFTVLALNSTTGSFRGRAEPPVTGALGTLAFSLFTMLLSLPVVILTDRYVLDLYIYIFQSATQFPLSEQSPLRTDSLGFAPSMRSASS